MLVTIRVELLRYLPSQQDRGEWRVRGSKRVQEDFVSKTKAGLLDGKQAPRMMRLIAMKEESYFEEAPARYVRCGSAAARPTMV